MLASEREPLGLPVFQPSPNPCFPVLAALRKSAAESASADCSTEFQYKCIGVLSQPTSMGIQYYNRPRQTQPQIFEGRPVLENRGLEMAETPAVPRVQRPLWYSTYAYINCDSPAAVREAESIHKFTY